MFEISTNLVVRLLLSVKKQERVSPPISVCRGLAPASLLPPDEADLVDGVLSVLGLVPHQVGGVGWVWCHTRWAGWGGDGTTLGGRGGAISGDFEMELSHNVMYE